MKKLIMISALMALCFGLTGIVQAVRPSEPPKIISDKPYVGISFTPESIDLGTVSPTGFKDIPAKLEARIIANCPHQIKASFKPFKSVGSDISIKPEDTSVEINGVKIPVDSSSVSIIGSARPTPPEGIGVPFDIKFGARALLLYPAGPYKGSLVLTIMTKP